MALPTALTISSILSPLSGPSETPSTFSRLSSKLGAPPDRVERPKAGGANFVLSRDTDASDFFLTMERRDRRSRGESRCSILVDHPLPEGVEADVGVPATVVGGVGREVSVGSLGVAVVVAGLESSAGFEVLVSSIKYAKDLLFSLASSSSVTQIFKIDLRKSIRDNTRWLILSYQHTASRKRVHPSSFFSVLGYHFFHRF